MGGLDPPWWSISQQLYPVSHRTVTQAQGDEPRPLPTHFLLVGDNIKKKVTLTYGPEKRLSSLSPC